MRPARTPAIEEIRRRRVQASTEHKPDTALRDIRELLERGVLRKSDPGRRSTSYELNDLRS